MKLYAQLAPDLKTVQSMQPMPESQISDLKVTRPEYAKRLREVVDDGERPAFSAYTESFKIEAEKVVRTFEPTPEPAAPAAS